MIIPSADRLKNTSEYYFSKKLEEIRALQAKGHDVINLGIGSPDLSPDTSVIEAASVALKSDKNHGYATYRGTPELRQAMAQFYKNIYRVNLEPANQILPLLGSKEGILYISMAYLNPGDSVLVPNPGYPAYTSVSSLLGLNPIYYDLCEENQWLPDFKRLNQMDLSRCKLMWVNYPHMPTGASAQGRLFKNLIAFGRDHKILIVNDNPYGLILNESPPLSILEFDPAREIALELNSLSKSFNMAGWRVGMVLGAESAINSIIQVKSNVDSGTFLPIQIGATEALKLPLTWHEKRNQIYLARKKAAIALFDQLEITHQKSQVGLFLWGKAPESVADVAAWVDNILSKAYVFLTPGFIFGSQGDRYLRCSLGTTAPRLEEALQRIKKVFGHE